jgi:hypothetical protein
LGYILGDFVTNSPLVTLNMESGGKKLLSQLVLETKNFRRRREEKKAASLLLPGVDVMITIFCDFRRFSAKKLAFFSKTNVMIKILHNLALF